MIIFANIYPKFAIPLLYGFVVNTSVFIVSLKSSMDVQSTDGRSLLLKYATSYVSKMKDHAIIKGLLQVEVFLTLLPTTFQNVSSKLPSLYLQYQLHFF